MAIPAAGSYASFDVTARTEARSVDGVLWDAMFAKSRLLEVLGSPQKIPTQRHEWNRQSGPTVNVTEANSANTTIDGSASLTALEVGSGEGAHCPIGTLLVNASKATPIGTYQRNEILQVTAVTGDLLTVTRDAGNFNSGTGFATHALTNKYKILYIPKQEGSKATDDENLYKSQVILENYAAIQSMKMEATGSQMARAMEVVASDFERQWNRELINLKNQMVNMILYGYNSSTAVGSDSVIRNSKGLLDFLADNYNSANGLIDYTTTTLTATALNNLFKKLWLNGADPSENLVILTSGNSQQVISAFDSTLVRTTYEEGRVGRYVTRFVSDIGFEAEVIIDPLIEPNDLFIVNPAKLMVKQFRPFETEEWGKGSRTPNGDDIFYQRTLGEHTIEVVDPGYAHAALTYLSW